MKFAICSEIFQGWPLDRAFTYAAQVGYDAIEIAPFTLAPLVTELPVAERRSIRSAAERAGLAVSGIHWVLARTEGFHLNHPDPVIRERTGRYLVELVRFCADLGGRFLVLGSPQQRRVLDGVDRGQAWEWAAGTLAAAVRQAEACGVTLCIEALAPTETNFLNTAAEASRFARGFGSPAAKIILDVKAMCSEALPIPDIIRASAADLAYFHANDRNLKGPGFGDVDFRPIAAALRAVNYTGYVSVEVFRFEEGPERIATESLACLRRAFSAEG